MSSLLCLVLETQKGPNQLDEFYFQKNKGFEVGRGGGGELHFPALEPEPWSVHSRHQCNNDTLILT